MLFRKLNIRETVATCLPIRLLHHYLGLYLPASLSNPVPACSLTV